jgi:hypothetical protein
MEGGTLHMGEADGDAAAGVRATRPYTFFHFLQAHDVVVQHERKLAVQLFLHHSDSRVQ